MSDPVRVPVSPGYFALVDAADAALVLTCRWFVDRQGRTIYAVNGKRQRLHRLLLGAGVGQEVDHINGAGLDNRRCNIRFATRAQNNANRVASVHGSRFKGVSRTGARWWAQAFGRYLGVFASEEEAARAYDAVARERHGEFARLNFPKPGEQCAVIHDEPASYDVEATIEDQRRRWREKHRRQRARRLAGQQAAA